MPRSVVELASMGLSATVGLRLSQRQPDSRRTHRQSHSAIASNLDRGAHNDSNTTLFSDGEVLEPYMARMYLAGHRSGVSAQLHITPPLLLRYRERARNG